MCDLLTDDYLDYLRSLDARLADAFDKHFNPLAAPFVPSLSPDAGKDGAVGGTLKQGDAS